MKNSESEEALFALLREALWGEAFDGGLLERLDAASWESLYRLAAEQGVLGLLWEALGRQPDFRQPPRPLRLRWAFETRRIERRWHRQLRTIGRLAAFYARHGIPMMLLKGYGLSRYYPVPEHRPCGDIDIWLFGRRAEGDAALSREWGIEIDLLPEHHSVFRLDDIPVENHYEFLNTSHAADARYERQLRFQAAAPCEQVSMGETRVYLPPATFQALFLLRHAAVHFAGKGIGLRHFADWMLFVAHNHRRIDWPVVEAAVRESGMSLFVEGFCALCVDRLGLDAACLPPLRRNPSVEARMLDRVLHPALPGEVPAARIPGIWFRFRRWWAGRWQRSLVYDESLLRSFLRMVRRHVERHWPFLRPAHPLAGG